MALPGRHSSLSSFSSHSSSRSSSRPPFPVWTGWEWEDHTHIIERFLVRLFKCPIYIDAPVCGIISGCRLRDYIAQVLAVKQLQTYVWGALLFLNRVKERYPDKYYHNDHQIFFCALMLSTKLFCDFAPNRWVDWSQGIPRRQIFQVERELCADLDWDFSCTPDKWNAFIQSVVRDFRSSITEQDAPWLFVTSIKRPGIPRPQSTVEWDEVARYHTQRRALRPREPVGNPPPVVAAPTWPHLSYPLPSYPLPSYPLPMMPTHYPFAWSYASCHYPPVWVR